MKKSLQLIAVAVLAFSSVELKAQLPDGSIAPNFTFTDMNGNTQDLYTYLNAGKSVVIDVSATWCGPCWSYHNSNALENFYNQYGPPGTNVAMVIWIEGDNATTNADMNGTGGNTQGNWVAGTPYPMCNPPSATAFNSAYAIGYFPTMYLICAADKKTKKVDQYTTAQLGAALTACPPVTPTQALDAGVPTIITPNGTACGASFSPIITLKNFGLNTLTTCTINYKIDNNTNQTFPWTGSLASNASVNVTLPTVTTTAGTHSFTCSTSSPNAGTDGNTSNDQKVSTFNATTTAMSTPVVEGLESATFPPTGWTLYNPDAATTWVRSTAAQKTGTASMMIDNNNYAANGQIEEFTSNPIDLSIISNPSLTFQVAYQMYTDPATYPSSDSLKVLVSSDCGVTWTNVYDKAHLALITATPQFSTAPFTPTASQWRLETVSLSAYSLTPSLIVKFKHTTDYENNMWIDDINISGTAGNPGVNELNINDQVSVYPNPSNGVVNVSVNLQDVGNMNIRIVNVLGEVVAEAQSAAHKMKFDLTGQPNGMYYIEVQSESGKALKKIMLNR